MADDDEMAAALLDAADDPEAAAPRLAEWTPERDELVRLGERISDLIAVTVQLSGQQLRIPPRPRPVTALDRARLDRRRDKHDRLVERLLPGGS